MLEGHDRRRPDWEFSFVDAHGRPPFSDSPGPHATELSSFRSALSGDLAALTQTCKHGQAVIRKYASEGVSDDELAVYSGLSIEHVRLVIDGQSMLEVILGR
jgi:hypothetical protein